MSEEKNVTVLTDELRLKLAPEFKALEDAAYTKGKNDGSAAERERIKAIETQGEGMPGHEQLIQEMKFDGKTTGPEAAVKLLAAEKSKKAARVADIRADAPRAVPEAAIDDPAKNEKQGSDPQKVDPVALAKEAADYRAMKLKEGIEVSNIDATKFVYQRAGVPLK
jgi:hypothetical protein